MHLTIIEFNFGLQTCCVSSNGKIRVHFATFCSCRYLRRGDTSKNGGKQYGFSSPWRFCEHTFTPAAVAHRVGLKKFNLSPVADFIALCTIGFETAMGGEHGP